MKQLSAEEKDLQRFLKKLRLQDITAAKRAMNRAYNRILTPEEKRLLDTESFGYLLTLYRMGTIDSHRLEKFIDHCLCIAYYEQEKLSLERTKKIVNMLLFCDNGSLKNKDFLALFKDCEDDISILEEIN